MLWCRMIGVAVRLAWPHVATPWRSPLVRWRLETFGLLDEQGQVVSASAMTPAHCLRFLVRHPGTVWRFLQWAVRLESA